MKDLQHHGVAWHVREMDTTSVPGARAERCLVFDSEGVVRRAWSFPEGWDELDDESIWALLERELPAPRKRPPAVARSTRRGDHLGVVTAVSIAASTRSFFSKLADGREPSESTVQIDPSRSSAFRQCRGEVGAAVANYTGTLKERGLSPERAIVLVKTAVQEGLDQVPEATDHVCKDLREVAVGWCIDTYYGF